MSDTQVLEGATPNPAAQPTSPGAMLRELRTAAGVNLAMVASMVKVTPQKLDALERDQFDQLPDMTFARGLVASVCRALGADPKPLLARMPAQSAALHLAPQQPAVVPFSRPGDAPAPLLASTAAKVVLAVIAILVAASVVVWFWPTMPSKLASGELSDPAAAHAPPAQAEAETDEASADRAGGEEEAHGPAAGAAAASLPATAAAAPAQPTTQPGVTTERLAPAGATATAPAAGSPTPSAGAAGTAVSAPAADTSVAGGKSPAAAAGTLAAAATAADTAPAAAAAASGQLLTLKATGESWVGVRDAGGKSLLNRTLKAGDTVDLDGQAPLSVVIGRKQAVTVLVRGQPFDDQSLSNATVARFQVK